jgi:hypothetical protein
MSESKSLSRDELVAKLLEERRQRLKTEQQVEQRYFEEQQYNDEEENEEVNHELVSDWNDDENVYVNSNADEDFEHPTDSHILQESSAVSTISEQTEEIVPVTKSERQKQASFKFQNKPRHVPKAPPRTVTKTKEQLIAEHEALMSNLCTFRPTINKGPLRLNRNGVASSTHVPEKSKATQKKPLSNIAEARLAQLSTNTGLLWAEKEAAKKAIEGDPECTFRPNISKSKITNAHRTLDAKPVGERLYLQAEKRAQTIASLRAMHEATSSVDATFKPVISSHSAEIQIKPIHERAEEVLREKGMRLAQLRQETMNANTDLVFKPRINPTSAKLAAKHAMEVAPNAATPAERLLAEAQVMKAKKEEKVAKISADLNKDLTFAPNILSSSVSLLSKQLEKLGAQKDEIEKMSFRERNQLLEIKRETLRESKREEAKKREESTYTFAPDIQNTKSVSILAQKMPERLNENVDAITSRLYRDAEMIRLKREANEASYYQQFTYTPEIDPVSRLVAKSGVSVEERSQNKHGKEIKERLQQAAEAEFASIYTFQPKLISKDPFSSKVDVSSREMEAINEYLSPTQVDGDDDQGSVNEHLEDDTMSRTSSSVPLRLALKKSSPSELSRKIVNYQRMKDAKLEAARRAKEYNELKECTFQPVTSGSGNDPSNLGSGNESSSSPVVVRGLGRFLELKLLSKKLEEERLERERNAFKVKVSPTSALDPILHVTIPEPFQFETEARAR